MSVEISPHDTVNVRNFFQCMLCAELFCFFITKVAEPFFFCFTDSMEAFQSKTKGTNTIPFRIIWPSPVPGPLAMAEIGYLSPVPHPF